MGFITAKSRSNNNNNSNKESWGMGFFLVFFPDNHNNNSNNTSPVSVEKNYSPLSSFSPTRIIKRSNSNSVILTRTQSTISICALLVFITLLLFTLSTFEPTIPEKPHFLTHRRFLHEGSSQTTRKSLLSSLTSKFLHINGNTGSNVVQHSYALQRMGVLYTRGTKAMNDLVVAHIVEHVSEEDFRLFLRLLYRSSILAKADVVFIFASSSSRFGNIIREEDYSFAKLIDFHREHQQNTTTTKKPRGSCFDVAQFVKNSNNQAVEPIWGRRTRSNNSETENGTESTQLSYGSIVGFEASELDPENSLSGFLEHVTMSMRRWACYPMLLGRVKRKFKHVMLIDVKNQLILSDPLGQVRNQKPDSVLVLKKLESVSGKHGKKTQLHNSVNSGVIMGGEKGVRRFANAMLNEIVRAAMQHKKKNSVTESGVLSQLVGNEFILKDSVRLVVSAELVPEVSQLVGSGSKSSSTTGSSLPLFNYSIVQRGNSNKDTNHNHEINSVIRKQLCSCEVDSDVYTDC